jgi:hypothetical protein
MPEQETWWTRFVRMLRGEPAPRRTSELPQVGEDGLLSEAADYPPAEGESPAERPPGALARWSKRDQTLIKLQEGYEKVTQVVEEVQKHLATQGERTERICNSLEQLARSIGDMPAISRQQAQTLDAIAGQLETTSARTQQLNEVLGELPKAARVQNETLSGIKRQLDMTSDQNVITTQTMEKLGTAVANLGDYNQAQTETLRDMNGRAADQNQQLVRLIAKQGKRFVALFIVTVVLAAGAISAVIVAIAMHK